MTKHKYFRIGTVVRAMQRADCSWCPVLILTADECVVVGKKNQLTHSHCWKNQQQGGALC